MVFEESLQKIGLTPNEIKIYIYLLKKGVSAGAEVHKDNELDKSSAYEALSNLNKKGLVFVLGQNRNQKFGAIPAERLFEIIEDKEKELKQVRSNVSELVENLSEYTKQNYKNKNIRIFEGKDGFKSWAWARLEAPKGSIIRDLSTDELQQSFTTTPEEYRKYSIDMPKERAAKGIFIRGLMKKSDIEKQIVPKSINHTDPKFLKEVRALPEDMIVDCSMVSFGNSVSFLRKKDGEFFGVIIDDKLITSIVNQLYNFLWESCPKI